MARNERSTETFQAAERGRGLRPDQDRSGVAGHDPLVVVRRGQEAGNHQLPDVQAGARWALLREDLRADQGLRVLVRQVQAPEAPRRRLREVRRGSHADQGAPRAHGPHRAREPGRAHLVPEVAAVAHRPHARHDAARDRADPLLRSVRRRRRGHDAAAEAASSCRTRRTSRRSSSTATSSTPGWAPRPCATCSPR